MNEPEVDREYLLVRKGDAAVEAFRFIRFSDGSATFGHVGWSPGIYGNSPSAWRVAWREAKRLGLVPVGEGIRAGLLTKDEADALTTRFSRPAPPPRLY
jgi:hypothetical protein